MDDLHIGRRGVLRGVAAVAAGSVVAGALPGRAGAANGAAELVLHGGQVLVMDRRFTVAEAVAMRNGRVVHVGDDRSVRRFIGRRTEVINLRGRTVLPGINDSHLHGLRTGLSLPPYNVNVDLASIVDVAAVVGEAVAQAEPGAWVRGKGWDDAKFAEGRPPTRADLDAVAPNHPVALLDWSNHQLWVNSKALEIAGVTATTPAPPGGVIVKDPAGEPTGLLLETAMGLVNAHIPPFTEEEQADAIEKTIDVLLSLGITSYTEPGLGETARRLYADKAGNGSLRVRVTALANRADDTYPVSVDQVREILAAPPVRTDPRWFAMTGVKLRADGVPIASRTAWMREPYIGGGRGSLVTAGDTDEERAAELTAMIRLVHQAGLQVGTHATGDAAIDAVAAAYARCRTRHDRHRSRHYVIHGDFAWPETLRLLAWNGCGVSLNPNIKHLIADSQPAVVGAERAAYQTPYRSALRAGVTVTSASDAPNVSPDWRQGLETALLREGGSGAVSGPDERIGLRDALRTYTTAAAWQDNAENWKGTLRPGMAADVCVLDHRLLDDRGRLAMDPHDISAVPVAWTVVGGTVAYDASDAAPAATVAAGARPEHMCAHC
ncbi:amidohydrolase [Actinophytocola gossypii]|uniref:Amidohydrolase n=1 Tax=Actinophytocola gossypii TaxID=2812003 RepID=A0ABT2JAS8_9PSEU|nr:amidohydrolase [Actinophytocola gossypii]MCT2584560.1 amidohydrolase [Actinophytocola gossypii]